MGRWKLQNDNSPYYDPNDTGPDQTNQGQPPPPGQGQAPPGGGGAPKAPDYGAPPQGGDSMQPWAPGGNSGFNGGSKFDPSQFQQTPQTDWSQYRTTPDQQGETSQQTYDRFQNDYHSEDKDKVMQDLLMARRNDWKGQLQGLAGSQGNINNGPGSQGNIYKPSTDAPATAPGTAPSTQTPPEGGWQSHLGWDTGKLNDPNKHDAKYDWLRAVQMAGGNKDVGKVVDIYNKIGGQYGEKASYSGAGDKVNFQGGNQSGDVDVLFDQEGKREDLWAPIEQGGGGGTPAPNGTPGPRLGAGAGFLGGNTGFSGYGAGFGSGPQGMPPGLGGGPQGLPGSTSGGFNPSLGDRNNSLWAQLAARSGQGLNISPKDPIIANQVNAFRAEQDRGLRNSLDASAESQGPYANLAGEKRLGAEHAAQATGGLQSQLMGQELSARRQEIQNALSQQGSMLSTDQQQALQQQLGMIDAALRQQGITNQNNQFLDNMGMQYWDRSNYWDQQNGGY